jgi:hypothetical protein
MFAIGKLFTYVMLLKYVYITYGKTLISILLFQLHFNYWFSTCFGLIPELR